MNPHQDSMHPLDNYMEAITGHIALIRQLSDVGNQVPLDEMKERFAASQTNILLLERLVEESQRSVMERGCAPAAP